MKIASIELISEISVHDNADSLEIAKILGWAVVVKKGEFSAGQKVVYIAVDSILEDRPEYEFLRNKNFRIKTIKLRGTYSQGIIFSTDLIKDDDLTIGRDISELVGAKHFEKPLAPQLAGVAKGNFPDFLRKTDSHNLCSCPSALEEMREVECYKTIKYDGSSFTCYYKDGVFGVCSRNLDLKEEEGNSFWKIARKYSLPSILSGSLNLAIQGELIGPGIQQNPLGLKELDLRVFDVFDISKQEYYGYQDLVNFCKINNLPMVKVIQEPAKITVSIKELQEESNNLKYDNGQPCEGQVIRCAVDRYSARLKHRFSAKVISQVYSLKHNE